MANVIKHKRGSGSDPVASDLVVGEVAIRTDVGKLFTKMDNGSVAEIAGGGSDIAINTLSSSSGTGGGSATFNGSAYRFTLSAPPSVSAQQLLVSINGVIQKPVAGTGQPSEGFSVDGTDIILGDAPATGSDFFILTFKSLGVSEPADNSVTSAKIVDGAIVNADINASAAIQGTKISPDFGSQAISTTNDSVTIGDSIIHSGDTDTKIRFPVANQISFETQGSEAVRIDENGKVGIGHDNPSELLTVKGNAPIIRIEENQSGGNKRLDLGVTNSGSVGFIGANQSASSLAFQTTNNERMRIDSSGNVGIGTPTPNTSLEISTATADLNLQRTGTHSTSDGPLIQFKGRGPNAVMYNFAKIDGVSTGLNNAGHLRFYTNTGGNQNERMRITSDGKVGIGTTSPTHLLHLESASSPSIKLLDTTNNTNLLAYSQDSDAHIGTYSNHPLVFDTNSSERMRIDSSGRLLLGTTTGGEGTADDFTIAGSGHVGMTIRSENSSECNIFFADGTSGNARFRGMVRYFHNSDALAFNTSAVERLRIDSSGRVGIGCTPTAQFDHNLIQIGNQATLGANASLSTTGQTFLTHNLYFDPSGNYQVFNTSNANEGTILRMFDGNFTFSNSAQTTGTPTVTERMRIDSSGRLLLGTTTTDNAFSGGDSLVIGTTSDRTGITLVSSTSEDGGLYFSKGTSANSDHVKGQIVYQHDSNGGYMRFYTNATERLRVLSGGGLTFNGDTATANALSDYEEGTWSPAVQQGVTNTQTFDSTGRYTKIGRQVYCQFLLQFSGAGTGARVQFSGLPFTSANNSSRGGGTVLWTNIPGLNDFDFISVIVAGNATNIECYQNMDSNATTGSGGFTNKAFYARFTYEAA